MIHDLLHFQNQYTFINESREILFNYCKTISKEHFIKEHKDFGRGSIRNLFVHIANVYEFWIASKALRREIVFTTFESVEDMEGVEHLFAQVDEYVTTFFTFLEKTAPEVITFERKGAMLNQSPLKLFTHVITHEFHHKGQILSMSRHLGYVPVDTDVIR